MTVYGLNAARAEGKINIRHASRVKVIKIEQRGKVFKRTAVLVEWRVLNEDPELQWLEPGDSLDIHLNLDVKPDVV